MKRLSIIVKPTHDCNLGCSYCYVGSGVDSRKMDDNTLGNMIEKSMNVFEQVSFIWHGGEPLLLPISFYEKVIAYQNRLNSKAVNTVQTNGTLLSKEYVDFFSENGFRLGFSIDGPKELTDFTRVYKDGNSAYADIMRGINMARNASIGSGAIVVVNRHNYEHLAEIYDWGKDQDIGLQFNPLISSGNAVKNFEGLGITPKEFGTAMVQLFDIWFEDNSSLRSLDPFDEIIGNLLTNDPWGCSFSNSCQKSFISVDPEGDVYPCGRFDKNSNLKLGNINEDNLERILNSDIRLKLQSRSKQITECIPCDYRNICNSGCMHNAYMLEGDVMQKDAYCQSYKMMFKHIASRINEELAKAEVEL